MTLPLSIHDAFATCNLHFCLYSLLGLYAAHRARLCADRHQQGERHDHLVHALLYLLLSLL